MARAGTVVILAAGQGTRMKSATPKVLHRLCGRTMLGWVLASARALQAERVVVVVGEGAGEVEAALRAEEDVSGRTMLGWVLASARALHPERLVVVVGEGAGEVEAALRAEEDVRGLELVVQAERRGTGHAVQVTAPLLARAPGPVVVLYGDMPLLSEQSLSELVLAQARSGAALLTVLPAEPRGFGRIVRGPAGEVTAIVEEKDASPEERALREVNAGVYCFDRDELLHLLPGLKRDNAQGEYYLTDLVALMVAAGGRPEACVLSDEREAIGVNTLGHLAEARAVLQERILERHLAAGVQIEDPATTYIDHGAEIGPRTRILPCTVIRSGVRVGADCEVGPFTHLRAGTVLEDGAEVGNFTEAKKAHIGRGTKAKHLSYLGDVRIGRRTNIGAGTIVANYDGKRKHETVIGDDAFIGSGTVLVAPTSVGNGAQTGAGAVVAHKEIPDGAVWVGVPARPLERRKTPRGEG